MLTRTGAVRNGGAYTWSETEGMSCPSRHNDPVRACCSATLQSIELGEVET
jgi:hypothetical protein